MILGITFLIFSFIELSIKILFRWRTWRDRGLFFIFFTVCVAALLWTKPADILYVFLSNFSSIPGGSVLLPALFFLLGLLGINPFLWVLFVGIIHAGSTPDLTLHVSLPMVIGNLPQTCFLVFTMPHKRSKAAKGSGSRPE